MLKDGAAVNFQGDYALCCGVLNNHTEIVQLLLEHSADVHANNKELLRGFKTRFDERMADLIIRYCNAEDYHYFPL